MNIRRIEAPPIGQSLSSLVVAASSSSEPSNVPALTKFHQLGGNVIHLHGEGGETHSRKTVAEWLQRFASRHEFWICTQICHDEWNEAAGHEVDRFIPDAVRKDIKTDLDLVETNYLDTVYVDDRPDKPFEPVMGALCSEIAAGRVKTIGLRNWSANRILQAHNFTKSEYGVPITFLITTELSPLKAEYPLWPGYTDFDSDIKRVVERLGLVVMAHAADWSLGAHVFNPETPVVHLRKEWEHRWKVVTNEEPINLIRNLADLHNVTTRQVLLAWILSQPFPVLAMIPATDFINDADEYVNASNLRLDHSYVDQLNAFRFP